MTFFHGSNCWPPRTLRLYKHDTKYVWNVHPHYRLVLGCVSDVTDSKTFLNFADLSVAYSDFPLAAKNARRIAAKTGPNATQRYTALENVNKSAAITKKCAANARTN